MRDVRALGGGIPLWVITPISTVGEVRTMVQPASTEAILVFLGGGVVTPQLISPREDARTTLANLKLCTAHYHPTRNLCPAKPPAMIGHRLYAHCV